MDFEEIDGELSFRVDTVPPGPVLGLVADRHSDGSLGLAWEPVYEDAEGKLERVAGYRVYRYTTRHYFRIIDNILVGGKRENSQILLWVRDEGVGIPREDLERVFERFYRTETEKLLDVRGAGLGLSVSKAIVEAHGGRIWAESAEKRGSVIYVSLPIGE